MKLQRILAGVLLLFCFSVSKADTSQNLIDQQAWEGVTYGADPGGCCASISASGPLFDTTTNTIMFSYGQRLIAQTIAINQALQISGVQVDGYQYGWSYRLIGKGNGSSHTDTLIFTVEVKDSSGAVVETYEYNYSGAAIESDPAWNTVSGTQKFANTYTDPQSVALKIIGRDGGFWGGYYGPEIKDIALRLTYTADPCAGNPLFDPSCNGYAEALAKQLYDQNCAADPLYDSGCPGYASAYETQQCNANPLYSQSCPGYQQAYYDQQCSFNPLYDTGCSGYQQAYYDQQCKSDPLYDSGCAGYSVAYHDNQCASNPLYANTCAGYQQAYFDQQCAISSLYDTGCPGYATAFYNQQCTITALYDTGCPGYQEAYATKMLLEQQQEETTATASPVAETAATVYADPVASLTTVSSTGDSVVDSVLATPVTIVASAPEVVAAPANQEASSNDTKEESVSDTSSSLDESVDTGGNSDSNGSEGESDSGSGDDTGGDSESGTSTGSNTDKKESTRDKVKKAMTEKAMALADDMSNAATIEAQKAVQAQVLAVMGYVPGFGAYGGTIGGGAYADAQMYTPTIVPESKRGLRNGLAQQILHEKIVESQYAR